MVTIPLPSGTILADRYQIHHPLGGGGMGTLYLARDLRFARRYVALKENRDHSPAARSQFRLEAEVLATLHHPNLPAVTDHFVTPDGRQFLVMDYVEGEDLEERVGREGPLPEAQVLTWADQVLDALGYLHAQSPPVIHRDVKPANIRITPEGKAVLVDFGITKQWMPGQRTGLGARAVSPGYSPSEQYSGGTDRRSDLYALGATLYFVLTGHVPPEAPLLAAGQTLPHPRKLNPAISRRTEAAILRAMQTDAGRRFQSAAEMRAALRGEAIRPREEEKKKWKTALGIGGLVAAMLLLCLLSVALGWWMYERGRTTPTPASAPTATVEIAPTEAVPGGAPATVQPTDTVPPGVPTSTPAAPIVAPATVWPTSTPAAPTVVPATMQPTDTVPPGAPTSTPAPTFTPTATRRPPTLTPTPTFTPTPQPTSPPPPPPPSAGGPRPTQPPPEPTGRP